jgi:S1-C subfamily serine protease
MPHSTSNGRPGQRALPKVVAVAIASFLLGPLSVDQAAWANHSIYRKTLQSVVWVVHDEATGSGVLIDAENRLVLTNQHVVGNERNVSVFFPAYHDNGFHAERDYYLQRFEEMAIPGRVLSRDIDRDLALVQIERVPDVAKPIEFGAPAEPGDAIHSIGNPGTSNALWIYTSGTVRANYFSRFEDDSHHRKMQILETDAPINHGDSGGPVVNNDGQLVALVQSMRTDARLVSQCVDITEVQKFMESRVDTGRAVVSAWHQVTSNTGDQRSQPHEFEYEGADRPVKIMMSSMTEEYGDLSVRRVWALGPVIDAGESPQLFAELLEENSRTKIGSWVFEAKGANRYQLIYVARLTSDLDDDAVASAIDYVARIVLTRM